jgi:Zn-dependent M28 family amino/carboxypeptidase
MQQTTYHQATPDTQGTIMSKVSYLALAASLISAGFAFAQSPAPVHAATTSATEASLSPDAQRWFAHVKYLANDDLKGRLIGTPEYNQAVQYVVDQFKSLGLKPAGVNGYQQPVPYDQVEVDASKSSFSLSNEGKTTTLEIGPQVTLSPHADGDSSVKAEAVFAGYGLSIPTRHIDEISGVNLKGKIAVILAGSPPSLRGPLKSYFRSQAQRWHALQQAGAIGIITIAEAPRSAATTPPQPRPGGRPTYLIADKELDQLPDAQLSATIVESAGSTLFAGSSHTLAELEALATAGKPLPEFSLSVTIAATTAVKKVQHFDAANVVAALEGSDPKLKKEYVVVSAHLDHLGVGRPVDGDSVYNGAMDNASGVASVIEIARSIVNGPRPRRSVLFLVVSGEEEGLLGSKYFVHYPTVPRKQIVGDINMDMFLPLFPLEYLEVQGLGESTLGNDVRAVAQLNEIEVQFDKQPDENRFVRSDQASFINYGIPALAFKFGWIPDSAQQKTFNDFVKNNYHHPSDDILHPIDKEAAAQFDHVLDDLTLRVANASGRPQWYPESFFAHQGQ